jgi:cell division GTPase FtsZ
VIKNKLFNAPVILSFGSGAGKIISQLSIPSVYKIAVNSSERDLMLIDKRVDSIVICGKGNGSGMDPDQGQADFSSRSKSVGKEIEEAIEESRSRDIDMIPCIFSLGHGFGSGSIYPAIEFLRDRYKNAVILPFVVTPFTWEGKPVIDRAYLALSRAIQLSTCVVISNEEVGSQYGDIGVGYDRINGLIGDAISTILRSFSATDGIIQTVDKNDFGKFFRGDMATVRHMKIKSAKDLRFSDIKDGIGRRWIKVDAKVFKPAHKLNIFYILDGKGPFNPQVLGDISDNISKKDYINMEYIKPLLIQRKSSGCDFVWMESGFKLKLDKNIYGEY